MTHDVRDVCTELHAKQKQEKIANGEGGGTLKILRPLLILNLKLINFNFKKERVFYLLLKPSHVFLSHGKRTDSPWCQVLWFSLSNNYYSLKEEEEDESVRSVVSR